MRRQKILIAFSEALSNWGSCRTISSNLRKSYELLESRFDIQWLALPRCLHERFSGSCEQVTALHEVHQAIQAAGADRVVFMDHLPHSGDVVAALKSLNPPAKLPPVVVHLYGDFTWFADKWLKLGRSLADQELQIICASHKQTNLVQGCLQSRERHAGAELVSTVPFPLDRKDYYFDPALRQKARKAWKAGSEDRIFIYTGRMSLQKNITRLLHEFATFVASSKSRDHLYLAGDFDDIGFGYLGPSFPNGSYFHQVNKALSLIPEKVRGQIRFLGRLNRAELLEAYCGADAFVSLSLYHDEDYGMSVGEALACGLPCVISDWGGYSSFTTFDGPAGASPDPARDLPSYLIPVRTGEGGILLSSSALQRHLKTTSEKPLTDEQRFAVSERFFKLFSVEAGARMLEESLMVNPGPFPGFNWKLEALPNIETGYPNVAMRPAQGTFYEKIYSPYYSQRLESSMSWNTEQDLIDWFTQYLDNGIQQAIDGERPGAKILKETLFPFCEKYASPSKPIFLFDGWNMDRIAHGKRWHVRDGVLPAFWFFLQESPESFPGELLVHEDLRAFVPPKWQPRVGYYRIESVVSEDRLNQMKGLLLGGLICPPFVSIPEFEAHLDRIVSLLGKERLARMEVMGYLPFRGNAPALWQPMHEETCLAMSTALVEKLGRGIRFISWNELDFNKALDGSFYYEINQGWIVKDSSLRHHVLSRGAVMLEALEKKIGLTGRQESVPLSPFHRLVVTPPGEANAGQAIPASRVIEEYAAIGNFLFTEKRFNHLWPSWFESLCRSSQKGAIDYVPRTDQNHFKN